MYCDRCEANKETNRKYQESAYDGKLLQKYLDRNIAEYTTYELHDMETKLKSVIIQKAFVLMLHGYVLVRFINTTDRHCNITVRDIEFVKLYPGQNILVMAHEAEEWDARDSCDKSSYEILSSYEHFTCEHLKRVTPGLRTLKDLALKKLSKDLKYHPEKIQYLPLPSRIKQDLLCGTIPVPTTYGLSKSTKETYSRFPVILDINPVVICRVTTSWKTWLSWSVIEALLKTALALKTEL